MPRIVSCLCRSVESFLSYVFTLHSSFLCVLSSLILVTYLHFIFTLSSCQSYSTTFPFTQVFIIIFYFLLQRLRTYHLIYLMHSWFINTMISIYTFSFECSSGVFFYCSSFSLILSFIM